MNRRAAHADRWADSRVWDVDDGFQWKARALAEPMAVQHPHFTTDNIGGRAMSRLMTVLAIVQLPRFARQREQAEPKTSPT